MEFSPKRLPPTEILSTNLPLPRSFFEVILPLDPPSLSQIGVSYFVPPSPPSFFFLGYCLFALSPLFLQEAGSRAILIPPFFLIRRLFTVFFRFFSSPPPLIQRNFSAEAASSDSLPLRWSLFFFFFDSLLPWSYFFFLSLSPFLLPERISPLPNQVG